MRSVHTASAGDQQLRSASSSPGVRTWEHRISVPSHKFHACKEEPSTSESHSKCNSPNAVPFPGEKGCWLGDPNTHINEGKKTWIVDGDEKKIAMAESMSDTPAKLAVAILTALFSMEELGAGCCTQAKDRNTLNPVYIRGIRMHLMYKYPEASAAEEDKRWKKILHINMNSKCRNSRAALKTKSSAAADYT